MHFKGERRSCPREICDTTIEFRLDPGLPAQTCIAAAVNISDLGMCIYTFDCFKEGDTIEIIRNFPVPYRKATVKWVKECCEDFYKMGIEFIRQPVPHEKIQDDPKSDEEEEIITTDVRRR